MKRYQIWDKESNVITPIGEVLTPEKWIERYPIAGVEGIKLIIGGGVINGSVCMEYTQTKDMYERMGCDFSECKTEQDVLDVIEAFEDERNRNNANTVTAEERIAAALEAQVMLSLPDENIDETVEDETVVTEVTEETVDESEVVEETITEEATEEDVEATTTDTEVNVEDAEEVIE